MLMKEINNVDLIKKNLVLIYTQRTGYSDGFIYYLILFQIIRNYAVRVKKKQKKIKN